MHIGQFSLVICSFVLAVTSYFIWPYEPSRLVPILILAGAVPLFVFARIFKRPTFRLYLTRAALVLLFASLGFAWAQMRSHMQARTADEIVVLRQRGHQYELDRLARHHGVAVREISCRPHCRLTLKGGIEFAYHDRLGGLTQSCRTVDVIVMPFEEARYSCRAQLVDSPAFAKRVHRQFTNENGRLLQQRLSNNRLWQRD